MAALHAAEGGNAHKGEELESKMAAFYTLGRATPKMAARGWLWSLGGVRCYKVKPLHRSVRKVRLPDPADPETPQWQLTASYQAKLFGRHGAASGVSPATLWPTPRQLQAIEEEERTWYPSLREMEMSLDAKEKEAEAQKRQREELIAARMAKMPEMIAAWEQEKEKQRLKEQEEKERKQLLLAEVSERFGHKVDQQSAEFQEILREMEETKKKELKLRKKQRREESLARKAKQREATASSLNENKEVAETADVSHQDTEAVESLSETNTASKL